MSRGGLKHKAPALKSLGSPSAIRLASASMAAPDWPYGGSQMGRTMAGGHLIGRLAPEGKLEVHGKEF